MGHIRLSREADLVVVAPASADLIARMATGLADDLATTALLASDKPVLIAPTMNLMMWAHPATQANLATLEARGVMRVGPGSGELACGEVGSGRMAEPLEIVAAIERVLVGDARLAGRRALVTSGPTREPIDPGALHLEPLLGQAGPRDRRRACGARRRNGARLGADARARAGRRQAGAGRDRRGNAGRLRGRAPGRCRGDGGGGRRLARRDRRSPQAEEGRRRPAGAAPRREPGHPRLASPSAATTGRRSSSALRRRPTNVVENARRKRLRKRCDWILANDVSPGTGTFGGDRNTIHLGRRRRDRGLADDDQDARSPPGSPSGSPPHLGAPRGSWKVELKILDPRLPGWGFRPGARAWRPGSTCTPASTRSLFLQPQMPAVLISAGIAFASATRNGVRWSCRAPVSATTRGSSSATRSG